VKGGEFVLADGKVVGKHKGFPFYTIGQRKGLEMAFGEPMYVNKIDAEKNQVVIGPKEDLLSTKMWVGKLNWQKYDIIEDGMKVDVQIRHHDPGTPAQLFNEENKIRVEFSRPVSAITPGQSAVFFEGDDVIGGGFIIETS
jgi:tRNA-specific 2-thiouridylase